MNFDDSEITDLTKFGTYLSTNNALFYYPLATPTNTEITGTLATQLESLLGANSYDTQTNLTQENDDLGFILDVDALKDIIS